MFSFYYGGNFILLIPFVQLKIIANYISFVCVPFIIKLGHMSHVEVQGLNDHIRIYLSISYIPFSQAIAPLPRLCSWY